MAEFSWPWPDSTINYDPQIGDGRKITAAEFAGWLLNFFGPGVIPVDNELEVTSPGANQIAVDTGWAICAGRIYHNDASLSLTPASAGAGSTRQDSVVLQCDWTGGGETEQYTVRAIVKEGTSGAPPALTQTENVIWEERLYSYTIDDAGAITGITDARTMATFLTEVSTGMIQDDAVTIDQIGAAAVGVDQLAAAVAGNGLSGGAGSALAVNVDGASIEINSDTLRVKALGVQSTMLANGAVTEGKIGASAVTYNKIGALAVITSKLDNNVLSADATGRGKMAASFFGAGVAASIAHFADAFWTNSTIAKFAASLFAADATSRGKFADGIWTNAKLAADCKRMVGEIIEISGATLGGTDGRRAVVGGVANESWVNCDGGAAVNGVTIPDLRDRVLAGASASHAAGTTGGADTANLAHPHAAGTLQTPALGHMGLGTNAPYDSGGVAVVLELSEHVAASITGSTASALSTTQDIRQATTYLYRFIYVG